MCHKIGVKLLIVRHPNLHADVSWDVLSKQILMNYDPKKHNISLLHEVIFILVVLVVVYPTTYNMNAIVSL